jgi:fluoroquinolone transport system ATP-binding protein
MGVGFVLPNHYLKLTAKENLRLFASFYPDKNLQDTGELFQIFGLVRDADKRLKRFSRE